MKTIRGTGAVRGLRWPFQENLLMSSYRYLHLDVFTGTRFEGNQLAVFLDARGLDTATMQKMAQEMNFAESTFLLPAESPETDIRMRIFTPAFEMPMAGHPTVGTTFALASTGAITPARDRWTYGLNIGPTPVGLEWAGDTLAFAWMTQRVPEFRPPVVPVDEILRAAGVDPAAVTASGCPVEEGSSGAAFIYVPVATREAVDGAEPDVARLKALRSAFPGDHIGVFVFSTEAVEPGVTVYSRMFAPGHGVPEDPGTGSASGPLGAYLVRHGQVAGDEAQRIVSRQGVKMGRPCRIHVRVDQDGSGAVTGVKVGGQAVIVAHGDLTIS
ncbi:MAG: PhzF family phenazine biosynthesis protein [Vicinamibacterales bacterium]